MIQGAWIRVCSIEYVVDSVVTGVSFEQQFSHSSNVSIVGDTWHGTRKGGQPIDVVNVQAVVVGRSKYLQAIDVGQLRGEDDRIRAITNLGMQVRTSNIQVDVVGCSITGTCCGTAKAVSGAQAKWQCTGREVSTGCSTKIFIVAEFHANAEVDRTTNNVESFDTHEAYWQDSGGTQDTDETVDRGNEIHESVGQAGGIQVQRVTRRITRSTHGRWITVDHDRRSRLRQDVECIVVVTTGDEGAGRRGE